MPRHIQNRITRAARRVTLAATAAANSKTKLEKVRLARASRDLKVAMKKARKLARKRKPRECARALFDSLSDARNRVQQLRATL
jgi:hypothetical protein